MITVPDYLKLTVVNAKRILSLSRWQKNMWNSVRPKMYMWWVCMGGFVLSLVGILTTPPSEKARSLFYALTATMFIILYGYT